MRGLTIPQISATEEWNEIEQRAGLGNHCSIRLSYGANGGFPSFLPLSGQPRKRKTRKEGLSMATQEVAQAVPVSPQVEEGWEAKSLLPGWPVCVVGNEVSGYRLMRKAGEIHRPLKAKTFKEAKSEAIMLMIANDDNLDRLFVRHVEVREPAPGFVYFIGGDVGGIKIGFAVNPDLRIRDLQCGSPIKLRILARVAGMPKDERNYHKQFAAHRTHGEWFERVPEIEAEIERLTPHDQR